MGTRLGFLGSLFLLASNVLFGQATATINGRVVDQGGAVLPKASVTITNAATGVIRETVTNEEGLYTVAALIPGNYDVKVQLPGFAPAEKKGVELLTGSNLTVDLQMSVGAVQESVSVEAQASLVDVTQAIASSSIRTNEVMELPMLNRSMGALMALMPGVRDIGGSVSAHGASSNWVSIGGGAGQNYNMLVDGIDNKEDHCGGTEIVYSLEGIQEFRMLTTGSNAEFGKGTATILMATKSGSNQLHGSGFFYGRNDSLVKIDYLSDPAHGGTGKPPFLREQWGGSLGGPIIKDKLWFFGSVERVAQDFSLPRPGALIQQLNYLVPLNINVAVTPSVPQPSRDLITQGKVNYQLNAKHSAFVRYSGELGYVNNDFGGPGTGFLTFAPNIDENHQLLLNAAAGETWVVNATTVNQFTAQWISFTHDNKYPQCPLNIPSLGIDSCLGQRVTFPDVSAGVQNAFPDWFNWERKWEFKDDFAKTAGRHALKFGVDYTWMPKFGGIFGGGSPGALTFFDDPSVIVNNTNGKYPQGFQTPGIVRILSETTGIIGNYSSTDNWGIGAYAQDDFRVSSKLTLNLGLRYDAYNYFNSPENLASNPTYQVLKAIGSPYGRLPQFPNVLNFEPRVGAAWDIGGNGKNVFRASYGIFYVQQIKNTTYQQEDLQKPFLYINQRIVDPAVGVGPLANFVYGVSALPPIPAAPTFFPPGAGSTGYWYDPGHTKDAQTQQFHVGWSHLFPHDSVLSVDYTHILLHNGWRPLDINPLISGVRPLAASLKSVYNDPALMGPVYVESAVDRSLYDETAVHFERRFSAKASFQANYVLAWSRGMGGTSDGTIRNAALYPVTPSATGGDIFAPWEFGPTSFDERHRVTFAGVFVLPFKIQVSPSMTAATARPYTLYRAPNPSGDGSLYLLGADGNPIGVNTQRGAALFMLNARLTRNFPFGKDGRFNLGTFGEFYNITDRANFGTAFGGNQFVPSTYQKPLGYLGGAGAVSTIPNSFQVQFGGRFTF
ncbi:MAG TPA: TonB-dependent receptor [Bryobacteraceae bacterium]|nr:TonB-dependent receptor [Bryobacteraceae bacterium]